MFSPSSFSRIKMRKIYARGGDIRRVICQKSFISLPSPSDFSSHGWETFSSVAKGNRNERFETWMIITSRIKSSRFNCDYYCDICKGDGAIYPSICVVVARFAPFGHLRDRKILYDEGSSGNERQRGFCVTVDISYVDRTYVRTAERSRTRYTPSFDFTWFDGIKTPGLITETTFAIQFPFHQSLFFFFLSLLRLSRRTRAGRMYTRLREWTFLHKSAKL